MATWEFTLRGEPVSRHSDDLRRDMPQDWQPGGKVFAVSQQTAAEKLKSLGPLADGMRLVGDTSDSYNPGHDNGTRIIRY